MSADPATIRLAQEVAAAVGGVASEVPYDPYIQVGGDWIVKCGPPDNQHIVCAIRVSMIAIDGPDSAACSEQQVYSDATRAAAITHVQEHVEAWLRDAPDALGTFDATLMILDSLLAGEEPGWKHCFDPSSGGNRAFIHLRRDELAWPGGVDIAAVPNGIRLECGTVERVVRDRGGLHEFMKSATNELDSQIATCKAFIRGIAAGTPFADAAAVDCDEHMPERKWGISTNKQAFRLDSTPTNYVDWHKPGGYPLGVVEFRAEADGVHAVAKDLDIVLHDMADLESALPAIRAAADAATREINANTLIPGARYRVIKPFDEATAGEVLTFEKWEQFREDEGWYFKGRKKVFLRWNDLEDRRVLKTLGEYLEGVSGD